MSSIKGYSDEVEKDLPIDIFTDLDVGTLFLFRNINMSVFERGSDAENSNTLSPKS